MRLFTAVYPDTSTKTWLMETQQRLRKELGHFRTRLRWIDPETAHITLVFLGHISDANAIENALAQCRFERMELSIAGLGVFPNTRHPAVLHVHVDDPSGLLTRLQTKVSAVLSPHVELELRRFTPHLTLARIKPKPDPRLIKSIRTITESWELPRHIWSVEEFALVQSQLCPDGAKHSLLKSFKG